ncbi:hypothetical protein GYB59_00585, partial [bacterium]|nr:hypothetical protein [bacterium]
MRHYLTILLALAVSFIAWSSPVDAQCVINAPGFSLDKGFDTTGIECPDDFQEPDWSEWIAQQLQLDPDEVCEVRTYDGSKVDVLTRCEAVE